MPVKQKCRCDVRAERRTLATIKQPVMSDSPTGQPVEGTPVTIGTAWGRFHKMHGTELYEAQEVIPNAQWKFFGGYEDLGTVTTDMYIEVDSKRYDVLDVDDLDYRHIDVVLTLARVGQ